MLNQELLKELVLFGPVILFIFGIGFGVMRPYLRRTKGAFTIDDEMPYVGIIVVVALVLLVLTTVTLYYFDFGLGIEVTTEDIRHSLSVLFSASIMLAFFVIMLPRVLFFQYKTITFTRPLKGFRAIFLILFSVAAIKPVTVAIGEAVVWLLETVWGWFF